MSVALWAEIFSAMDFGMSSESPTWGRTGGDLADAVIEKPTKRGSPKLTVIVYWNQKNEVAKATTLVSRCSVFALVSALVTSCVRNAVVAAAAAAAAAVAAASREEPTKNRK
jgi:hypothetical protein